MLEIVELQEQQERRTQKRCELGGGD